MPTIFIVEGFRFFFYSNEGNPREPLHVHVRKGGGEAKIWLHPAPRVARSFGLDDRALRLLLRLADERKTEIEGAWREHFGA